MAKPIIYFICIENRCRSQMAEGFMRKYYGDIFDVYSGGTIARSIHPWTIDVMNEKGIDISHQTSKSIELEILMNTDIAIYLCRKDESYCYLHSKIIRTFHWDIKDPVKVRGTEEEVLAAFQRARDDIEKKIHSFDPLFQKIKASYLERMKSNADYQ